MKRILHLFLLLMFLIGCSQTARAQLSVDITTVQLSNGDPAGTGTASSPGWYNVTTQNLFRWNGAKWAVVASVSVGANAGTLYAMAADPIGVCSNLGPGQGVINTVTSNTFGCVDGKWARVTLTSLSGSGTLTNVTVAGTAGQITATGTCTSTAIVTCTFSLPSVLILPGTINKLTLTQPATGATLTVNDGKTLTITNTLTVTGTDATTISFPNPSAVTNGDCVAWGKSGSTLSLTDVACGGGGGGATNPCLGSVTSTFVVMLFAAASSTNPCNLGTVPFKVTAPITLTMSGTTSTDVVWAYFDLQQQQIIAGVTGTMTTYTFSSLGMVQTGISTYPAGDLPILHFPTTANAAGTIVFDLPTGNATPIKIGNGLQGPYDPTTNLQTLSIDPTHTVGLTQPVTLTDAATVTWAIGANSGQASASLQFTVHVGSRTLNLTGMVLGGVYSTDLIQDGTGGVGLILGTGCTWKVKDGGGGAVTLSTGAGVRDVLAWKYDGVNCDAALGKNFN